MITITKPTGEQIRIDGTKISRSGSSNPESWEEEDPVIIEMLIRRAWRRGWQVKEEA